MTDIKAVDMSGISVSGAIFDTVSQSLELTASEDVLFKLYSDASGTAFVDIECKSVTNDGAEKGEENAMSGQTMTLLIAIISVLAIVLLGATGAAIYYKQAAAKSKAESMQMVSVVSPTSPESATSPVTPKEEGPEKT